MHNQDDDVVEVRELEDGDAQQGSGLQIEAMASVELSELQGGLLALLSRQEGEVGEGERQGRGRLDELSGKAIKSLKGGAEDFVTVDDESEGALESVEVEEADDLDGGGDVEGGVARLDLIEEP
jgi:hypothetical protein